MMRELREAFDKISQDRTVGAAVLTAAGDRAFCGGIDLKETAADEPEDHVDWAWEDRYAYQKAIYSRLGELRRFDLPLYVTLPWRRTDQHDELLEIVVRLQPEYGRVHHPDRVRALEALIGLA